MEKFRALFVSFDGETQTEGNFETIEEAWEYVNDIGSKWFFYPFCFVVKGNTVKDIGSCFATPLLSYFKNRRIKTLLNHFRKCFKLGKDKTMDAMDYEVFMYDKLTPTA